MHFTNNYSNLFFTPKFHHFYIYTHYPPIIHHSIQNALVPAIVKAYEINLSCLLHFIHFPHFHQKHPSNPIKINVSTTNTRRQHIFTVYTAHQNLQQTHCTSYLQPFYIPTNSSQIAYHDSTYDSTFTFNHKPYA